MIRAVSVMATRSGIARTSLPLQKSASSSKVLCAMDSCFPTPDFRPDEDGIIDLTTPENDVLYRAQLSGRRSSSTGL
jgi:hypothetical protein